MVPTERRERRDPRASVKADLASVVREVLESMMREAGLSQRAFAAEIGVPQRTLHNLMSGHMKRGPTLDALSRVCTGLGIDAVDFLTRHPLFKPGGRVAPPPAAASRVAALLVEAFTASELREVERILRWGIRTDSTRLFVDLGRAYRRAVEDAKESR